jgi:hypothetical protein
MNPLIFAFALLVIAGCYLAHIEGRSTFRKNAFGFALAFGAIALYMGIGNDFPIFGTHPSLWRMLYDSAASRNPDDTFLSSALAAGLVLAICWGVLVVSALTYMSASLFANYLNPKWGRSEF